jgi:hypothetical protein
MGQELHCIATWNERRSVGTASLETEELRFRGEFRLRIPFKTITDLAVASGRLTVTVVEGIATFNLGPRAEQWAERIRNPKSVLEKMGIKPESVVSVVGIDDKWFLDDLRTCVDEPRVGRVARNSDVIIVAINKARDLAAFTRLQASLKANGALWAVRPKGTPEVSESTVMNAARAAGLVDVKVVRFSTTHTAEKFVRPKLSR